MPAQLVKWVLDHQLSTWEFLLAINVLLLILGCFLEVVATLLLVLPILAPALMPLGVDPVHFSIIFTHNMEIALVHPPVGPEPLCAGDHLDRADRRGHSRHPAVPDPALDRADDHHILAAAHHVAAALVYGH